MQTITLSPFTSGLERSFGILDVNLTGRFVVILRLVVQIYNRMLSGRAKSPQLKITQSKGI